MGSNWKGWRSGEPKSGANDQDCAIVTGRSGKEVSDKRCSEKYPVMCQKEKDLQKVIGNWKIFLHYVSLNYQQAYDHCIAMKATLMDKKAVEEVRKAINFVLILALIQQTAGNCRYTAAKKTGK